MIKYFYAAKMQTVYEVDNCANTVTKNSKVTQPLQPIELCHTLDNLKIAITDRIISSWNSKVRTQLAIKLKLTLSLNFYSKESS